MAKNNEPKPEKEKKPKKPPVKKSKPTQDVSLPLFAEVFFSFSNVFLIVVTLVIVLVSFMSGATLLEVFLRAVVGVALLGSVLWFLTYQVSASLVNARLTEQPAQQAKPSSAAPAYSAAGNEPQNQPAVNEVRE